MKGDSSCHVPNDKYREGWDRIFGQNGHDIPLVEVFFDEPQTELKRMNPYGQMGDVSYEFDDAMDNLLGRKEWPGGEYVEVDKGCHE